MGRHAVSSPLRTPAVLVGVPVATALATFGTTAVLGGVVPSAEEAPLRAEAPAEVVTGPDAAVPQSTPSPPAVSLDTPLLPTADAEPAPSTRATPRVTVIVTAASAASAASDADDRPTTGPRVVRVGPAVAPSPEAAARVTDVDDGPGDDDVTSTVVPGPRRDAGPRLAPRAVTASSPVETAVSRSTEETEHADRTDADSSAVDLDTPSGGLSLLTFG